MFLFWLACFGTVQAADRSKALAKIPPTMWEEEKKKAGTPSLRLSEGVYANTRLLCTVQRAKDVLQSTEMYRPRPVEFKSLEYEKQIQNDQAWADRAKEIEQGKIPCGGSADVLLPIAATAPPELQMLIARAVCDSQLRTHLEIKNLAVTGEIKPSVTWWQGFVKGQEESLLPFLRRADVANRDADDTYAKTATLEGTERLSMVENLVARVKVAGGFEVKDRAWNQLKVAVAVTQTLANEKIGGSFDTNAKQERPRDMNAACSRLQNIILWSAKEAVDEEIALQCVDPGNRAALHNCARFAKAVASKIVQDKFPAVPHIAFMPDDKGEIGEVPVFLMPAYSFEAKPTVENLVPLKFENGGLKWDKERNLEERVAFMGDFFKGIGSMAAGAVGVAQPLPNNKTGVTPPQKAFVRAVSGMAEFFFADAAEKRPNAGVTRLSYSFDDLKETDSSGRPKPETREMLVPDLSMPLPMTGNMVCVVEGEVKLGHCSLSNALIKYPGMSSMGGNDVELRILAPNHPLTIDSCEKGSCLAMRMNEHVVEEFASAMSFLTASQTPDGNPIKMLSWHFTNAVVYAGCPANFGHNVDSPQGPQYDMMQKIKFSNTMTNILEDYAFHAVKALSVQREEMDTAKALFSQVAADAGEVPQWPCPLQMPSKELQLKAAIAIVSKVATKNERTELAHAEGRGAILGPVTKVKEKNEDAKASGDRVWIAVIYMEDDAALLLELDEHGKRRKGRIVQLDAKKNRACGRASEMMYGQKDAQRETCQITFLENKNLKINWSDKSRDYAFLNDVPGMKYMHPFDEFRWTVRWFSNFAADVRAITFMQESACDHDNALPSTALPTCNANLHEIMADGFAPLESHAGTEEGGTLGRVRRKFQGRERLWHCLIGAIAQKKEREKPHELGYTANPEKKQIRAKDEKLLAEEKALQEKLRREGAGEDDKPAPRLGKGENGFQFPDLLKRRGSVVGEDDKADGDKKPPPRLGKGEGGLWGKARGAFGGKGESFAEIEDEAACDEHTSLGDEGFEEARKVASDATAAEKVGPWEQFWKTHLAALNGYKKRPMVLGSGAWDKKQGAALLEAVETLKWEQQLAASRVVTDFDSFCENYPELNVFCSDVHKELEKR